VLIAGVHLERKNRRRSFVQTEENVVVKINTGLHMKNQINVPVVYVSIMYLGKSGG
jgi:hypothetical protein